MYSRVGMPVAICLAVLTACQTLDDVGNTISGSVSSLRASLNGSEETKATPQATVTPREPAQVAAMSISGSLSPNDVTDGDTIRLGGKRIRLHGIDAPELDQQCQASGQPFACGQIAREVLIGLTAGTLVTCERLDVDKYGREVGRCFADGYDIEAGMVRSGYAVAYREYSLEYIDEEDAAKREKLGMWRGTFQMPWDWRAFKRQHKKP